MTIYVQCVTYRLYRNNLLHLDHLVLFYHKYISYERRLLGTQARLCIKQIVVV